ncbi:MAG TPA: MFS transporter [Syntrophorhabdaceae bacterium]|nr:MFS transporter [Syntrophorhabdaceae bacterium]
MRSKRLQHGALIWNTYDAMNTEEKTSSHSLRNILTRDFVCSFLALFTFIVAYHALIPTLPIYFSRLGSNEAEIGILVGVFGVSSLIFRFVVGGALQRYSARSIMMCGAVLFGLTFVASLVVRPFWPFFAVRFFQGAAFSCMDTAVLAFVVSVTPLANRARVIGYFVLAPPLSQAMSPAFGMFLINQYNFTVLFLVCMVLTLCALASSYNVSAQESHRSDKDDPPRSTHYFDGKVIIPSLVSLLQNFVWGAVIAFLPLYASRCGVSNPGLFFSANGVMLIVGRALGGKILDSYNKEKMLLILVSTLTFAVILLAFSKTLTMFIIVGLIWGAGSAFFFPVSMAYALDYTGTSDGTTVGTFRAISDLGIAMGPVAMGVIIPATGYQGMFLCLASINFMNLCCFQFYVRKRGRRP